MAITRGDHTKSLALFRKALRLSDEETSGGQGANGWYVRLQLAQVLGALGQPVDALNEFKRVIADARNAHADVLLAAGICLFLRIQSS